MKIKNSNKKGIWHTVVLVILAFVVISALGMGVAIQSNTLAPRLLPTCALALAACLFGIALKKVMRAITESDKWWLNYAAGAILGFSLLFGAFYGLNFFLSDAGSAQPFATSVTRKYTEERRETQRNSRRHYTTRTRTAFCLEVTLPNGRVRKYDVSPGQYAKTKVGHPVTLTVETGFFGIPVVKDFNLKAK